MQKERKAITKWTKHGYTPLVSPDDRTYNDIVVSMEVQRNPGPTEDENDTKVKAYIDHRTPYSRIILITLRKKATKPTSEAIEALKSNFIFKYRGNRAGRYQNKKGKEMENIQISKSLLVIDEQYEKNKCKFHMLAQKGQKYDAH